MEIETIKLDLNKNYKKTYKDRGYLTAASLLMHEDCNLACTYCYEKDNHHNKKISNEMITKALDFLFDNAQKKEDEGFGADAVAITLFGGEPTLNPEGIYHTMEYGIKKMRETNIGFNVNMITNTTILPKKLEEAIKKFGRECNFGVQMSVDGPGKVQDSSRIYKNGDGSWEQVKEIIPKYMKLAADGYCSISLHGVLDENNIQHLFTSYKYFIDLGIERLWFIAAHNSNWTDENVSTYDEELGKIREYIIQELKKGRDLNFVNNYAPLDRCLSGRTSQIKPCGAGDGYCSINYTGEIHACHQFYYYDQGEDGYELSIGNVETGVDLEKQRVYIEYDGDDLSCPGTCDHYSCYRCIASNYEETGSMLTQIRGRYCEIMKIDQKHQNLLKKEVELMGLLKPNTGNNDSQCDCQLRGDYGKNNTAGEIMENAPANVRTSDDDCDDCNGCDVVKETENSLTLDTLKAVIQSLQRIENKLDEKETLENNKSITINVGK